MSAFSVNGGLNCEGSLFCDYFLIVRWAEMTSAVAIIPFLVFHKGRGGLLLCQKQQQRCCCSLCVGAFVVVKVAVCQNGREGKSLFHRLLPLLLLSSFPNGLGQSFFLFCQVD